MTATTRPLQRVYEERPAPGFEIFEEDPDYIVTMDDIERYTELEGVRVIKRAYFEPMPSHSTNSYYVSGAVKIVDLEEWGEKYSNSCHDCGGTQGELRHGKNGTNASFHELECTACGKELFRDIQV